MTSLLSSIARSFSGEVSRSYSGRSNSIQSVPSLNDFNSLTFIEAPEELETQAHTEQKYKRHSVDMGQLYTTKGGPADAVATVTTEAPASFGAHNASQPWDIPGRRGLANISSPSKKFAERKIDPGHGRKMDMYEYCELIRSL